MPRKKKARRPARTPRRSGLAAFDAIILETIIRPRIEATGSKGFTSIRNFCKQFCADQGVDVSEKTFRDWLTRLGIAVGPIRLTLTTPPAPAPDLLPVPVTRKTEAERLGGAATPPREAETEADDANVFDKGPVDADVPATQIAPGTFAAPGLGVVGGLMPPG